MKEVNLLTVRGNEKVDERGGEKMEISTRDLWESAYLMSEGEELEAVRVSLSGKGKREVEFVFEGEKVNELVLKFQSGQATCRVTQLKASMNHLKDVIFKDRF